MAPRDQSTAVRVRLVAVVAVVSLLVFAPWAIRDWVVFGNPLPGQALSNALSITGFDIFAWNDPPTLARYLAIGPGGLLDLRVVGIGHNLFNVLLLIGVPISILGLLALPWQGRDRALRPVLLIAGCSRSSPRACCSRSRRPGAPSSTRPPRSARAADRSALGVLDAGIAALGRRLGWTGRSPGWARRSRSSPPPCSRSCCCRASAAAHRRPSAPTR